MAHHREKAGFFLIGIQRFVAGADNFFLFLELVGDVADVGHKNRCVVRPCQGYRQFNRKNPTLAVDHLRLVAACFCQSRFTRGVEMRDVVALAVAQFGRDQQFDIAAPQRVIARDAKDVLGGAVEIDDLSIDRQNHHRVKRRPQHGFKLRVIAFDLARGAVQGDGLARQPEDRPQQRDGHCHHDHQKDFDKLGDLLALGLCGFGGKGDRGEADIAG